MWKSQLVQFKLFPFTFFSIFLTVIHNELIFIGINLDGLGFEPSQCSLDFDVIDILDMLILRIIRLYLMGIKLCVRHWDCIETLLRCELVHNEWWINELSVSGILIKRRIWDKNKIEKFINVNDWIAFKDSIKKPLNATKNNSKVVERPDFGAFI
jgi:hypothetical protein